jgi:hypothetical protein
MTILTDKPSPWYQMIVENTLDRLIWSQFKYTDENCKEIEDCLDRLETFKVHYQDRLNRALDSTVIMWYNQRIKSIEISIDYYKRNYEARRL